jgi:hypothetical protein
VTTIAGFKSLLGGCFTFERVGEFRGSSRIDPPAAAQQVNSNISLIRPKKPT